MRKEQQHSRANRSCCCINSHTQIKKERWECCCYCCCCCLGLLFCGFTLGDGWAATLIAKSAHIRLSWLYSVCIFNQNSTRAPIAKRVVYNIETYAGEGTHSKVRAVGIGKKINKMIIIFVNISWAGWRRDGLGQGLVLFSLSLFSLSFLHLFFLSHFVTSSKPCSRFFFFFFLFSNFS